MPLVMTFCNYRFYEWIAEIAFMAIEVQSATAPS